MAITTGWDNDEKTIIRHIYEGTWTWEDFYASMKQAAALVEGIDYPVNIIIDIRNSSLVPHGMVTHINRLHTMNYWRPRKTVLVGANGFVRSLHRVFLKMNKGRESRFTIVETLDEAYHLLL